MVKFYFYYPLRQGHIFLLAIPDTSSNELYCDENKFRIPNRDKSGGSDGNLSGSVNTNGTAASASSAALLPPAAATKTAAKIARVVSRIEIAICAKILGVQITSNGFNPDGGTISNMYHQYNQDGGDDDLPPPPPSCTRYAYSATSSRPTLPTSPSIYKAGSIPPSVLDVQRNAILNTYTGINTVLLIIAADNHTTASLENELGANLKKATTASSLDAIRCSTSNTTIGITTTAAEKIRPKNRLRQILLMLC